MTEEQDQPAAPSTKARILHAAFRRFAAASYDETHLRDIAADVGVDVAYVHRSFGSKERLFLAVLAEASRDHGVADTPLEAIADQLTRNLFADPAPSGSGDPEPLQILIRSLTVPLAAGPVGEKLAELFILPIQDKLGDKDSLRAATIMSMLIGLTIIRNFLRLPGLQEIDKATARQRIGEILEDLLLQPHSGGAGYESEAVL